MREIPKIPSSAKDKGKQPLDLTRMRPKKAIRVSLLKGLSIYETIMTRIILGYQEE